jgi:hypothetical protein
VSVFVHAVVFTVKLLTGIMQLLERIEIRTAINSETSLGIANALRFVRIFEFSNIKVPK